MPINAAYDLAVTYPVETGTGTAHFSNSTTLGRDSSVALQAGSVSYPSAGTFHYSAELSFEGFSKTYEGDIVVVSDGQNNNSANALRIVNVSLAPKYPKEGDTISFRVIVSNSYSSSKTVRVRLFVDGKQVDPPVDGNIGANSKESFTLHWLAKAGEHSYEVKVCRVVNDEELFEDSAGGSINVAKDPDGIYAWLEITPTKVEADGAVNVTVRVENHNSNECFYQGSIKVIDDRGLVLWPSSRYSATGPVTYPCEIFELDYTITDGVLTIAHDRTMVENFTLRHVSRNTTLHLLIGGVEMASAKINVVQQGPVVATLDCPDTVAFDNEAHCTIHLTLIEQKNMTLHLEKIDFGGKKVWPNGLSGIWVEQKRIKLIPYYTHNLSFSIKIDDALANYYFEKSPWFSSGSYKDGLAGHLYLVRVVFSDNISASRIVKITSAPLSWDERGERGAMVIGITNSALQKIAEHKGQLETVIGGPLGKVVSKVTPILDLVSWGLTARDCINWLRAPTPSDGDNNNVIGG